MKYNFLKLLNYPLKKTWWYESTYGDAVKMKNWNTYGLDLVNLGSSSPKFACDYSNLEIKAANWAMAPQGLINDLAILKNYHSFIKENGFVVVLQICPFNLMTGEKKRKGYYDKYHYFLSPVLIKCFSRQTQKKICRMIDYPLLGSPKVAIKAIVKKMLGKDKACYLNAETDAKRRINSWKKQFLIESFSDPLSEEHLNAIKYNVNLLYEIIEFCRERSLKPVLGIMPATKTLKEHIPEDFMQRAFYDAVEKVKEDTGILFLDYYRSTEFENDDLYLDSFLMNKKGRELFTQRMLTDLGITNKGAKI